MPGTDDLGAFFGEQFRPARQCTICRLYGAPGLAFTEIRHPRNDVSRCLVGDRQPTLADPLAVYVALAANETDGGFVHGTHLHCRRGHRASGPQGCRTMVYACIGRRATFPCTAPAR